MHTTPLSKKKGVELAAVFLQEGEAAEADESAGIEARGRPRKLRGYSAVYEGNAGVES